MRGTVGARRARRACRPAPPWSGHVTRYAVIEPFALSLSKGFDRPVMSEVEWLIRNSVQSDKNRSG
jgi:hypothetical protein